MPVLRRAFHERLRALEDEVLDMGQRALAMLADATEAITGGDPELATRVEEADDDVDARYRAAQEGLLDVLALEWPVASELRLVSALIHVSLHLERVGDLCVNMAKLARSALSARSDPALSAQVEEMSGHAARALERALQCFARRDVEGARELDELDDVLDRMNRRVFKELVLLAGEGERQIDWAFAMVLVARFLERIGDHAVDIAEQVEFCVTGAVSGPVSGPDRGPDRPGAPRAGGRTPPAS